MFLFEGTLATDIETTTHTYTQLGIFTISGIAMGGMGNTTIKYVAVVQIPVDPNAFQLTSTAPTAFDPGEVIDNNNNNNNNVFY